MLPNFSYRLGNIPRPGGKRKQSQRSNSMTRTSSSSTSAAGAGDGSGDQTISSTDYARRCRDLMALYKDLLALGAKTIFDLPRVVVIGGQSSGKSSLVEAVSGINVPRDSGTCTRCPMVCTMSSDVGSWSCNIEILYEYTADGQPLKLPTTVPFGPPSIDSKGAVELWIRRAQAAILSPHRPAADFLKMTDAELKTNAKNDKARILEFSKNVVQVNVQDPEATDLSFVDLPGLIQNADLALIAIVRTLVESYVVGRNTLIVIAMPMSDDIEMMQALVIAGKADPEKERTIGVLTKPDALTKGATGGREKWKAVLEGREHATTHGYYCVRLPDDDERARKVTPMEAQRNAANFFDTNSPWDKMLDRSRFGIPNFVSNISALLVERIEKNLPELRKAVENELVKCNADLALLPPLSNTEPSTEIILRVNAFCKDVSDSVRGVKEDKRFLHLNKARYVRFKESILGTTPDFRPYESATGETNLEGSLVSTSTEPRWLCDVRKVIKRSIGWELPGEIPFEATKVLIMQYTGLWPAPSKECFEDVSACLRSYLEDHIEIHFGQFKYLERYANNLIFDQLESCLANATYSLDRVLALECSPLFTQNFDAYSSEKKKWLAKYESARKPRVFENVDRYGASPFGRVTSSVPISVPSPALILHTFPSSSSDADLDATPKTWTLDEELRVISNVQAYFQVAHQRIIDYVPLTIEHELNQAFSSRLDTTLLSSIFKDVAAGTINIEELLQEDPVIEKKRKELNERKTRLVQIKAKLDHFGSSNVEA